ncbi:uncharacterized protein LOC124158003 isoform X3 [Ischnura elegans]|uniref:uncharacterized protein LOC124158003 isoform X3 n=1 Tax=Ischnura elegans TaxID=197161 RepID=UPI001ED88439|nr:uncharacterized protein LOC124158003 isoform X3 [Ischnura elegans]XP_046389102.1 uncharacterized protein LOC124158003 isoform X3 [Ischnura elegans]
MKRRYLEVIKMSGRKTYVYCSVPRCESTSHKTPEKYFFVVPKDPERRKRWYDAARRQHIPSEKGCYRICEDHFNYEADLKNYQEHRLTNARPLLKKDAVPSKFDCQSSRKRKEPRISSLQRARKQLIGEIIAGHQEDNNRHQEPLMENLLPFQSIVANCECVDHQGDNNEQQEPLLENLLPFHSIATNCESTDGSASIGAKDAINPCTPPRNQQKRGQKQKKSHFRSHGVQVTPRMHGRACWPMLGKAEVRGKEEEGCGFASQDGVNGGNERRSNGGGGCLTGRGDGGYVRQRLPLPPGSSLLSFGPPARTVRQLRTPTHGATSLAIGLPSHTLRLPNAILRRELIAFPSALHVPSHRCSLHQLHLPALLFPRRLGDPRDKQELSF